MNEFKNAEDNGFLTVSRLNQYVKLLLDGDPVLSSVVVRGEIANFKRHYPSGHLYFSLRDAGGTVRCVMFASAASKLRADPANGDDVIVYGNVSVFPREGTYQVYVTALRKYGLGDQLAALERLRAKLAAEGLFDRERKKPLPAFPGTVGLVTSDTGAAVRDLIHILGRRFPSARVILYPALVQGPGAAATVADGIRWFNSRNCADVIIIGRGGGSGEDLWAFNDEALARAAAASDIPVISAVGHETDFTLTDFAADLRAPTPSAAAELAVPDSGELAQRLAQYGKRLAGALGRKADFYSSRLEFISKSSVMRSPGRFIDLREAEVARLNERLAASYGSALERCEYRVSGMAASLNALSPLKVLGRGYAVVRSGGRCIGGVSGLSPGDAVTIVMRDGRAEAVVTSAEAGGRITKVKE
jgi:exodeoxyribonuclease VII large subunit